MARVLFQILFDIWWFLATRIFPSDDEVHQARGKDCCSDTSDMIMTQLGYRNYWLGATVTRPTDVDITGINSNHVSLLSRQCQLWGLEKHMIGHLQGVIEIVLSQKYLFWELEPHTACRWLDLGRVWGPARAVRLVWRGARRWSWSWLHVRSFQLSILGFRLSLHY